MFTSLEKKLLLVLAFVQFNHIVDFMIIMPLGPQLMRLFSIQPNQFSLLVSSYTFMAGLSGFLASFYTDKFDRKKSLLYLFAGFTMSTALCGLARNYEQLLFARALTGFFGGVMNSIVMSILSDVIEYKRRGTAMGVLSTAFSAASIAGIPLSIYLSHSLNWFAPFLFLACLCLVTLWGAYKYIPKIDTHLTNANDNPFFWQPVLLIFKSKTQMMALAFMFFVMFSHFCIIPFISPSMVANAGISEEQLTLIYLVGGLCSFMTAPFVGKFADRFGKAKVFTWSVLFSITPIYLLTHQGVSSLWITLMITGFFFISAGARMIPAQALISSAVTSSQRGAFMSLLSCTQSMAMALGTYMAGALITKDVITGKLLNYSTVGFIAIAVGLFTLIILHQIKYLDLAPSKDEVAIITVEAL